MSAIKCDYQNQCGGCPTISKSLDVQAQEKRDFLSKRLGIDVGSIKWISVGYERLRDRVDLTWIKGQGLGLYHVDKYEIVDLENCPMMSVALEAWFQEFRKIPPPVNKGSIRLRVGPQGQRGVWLDFANVDIKNLLDERSYLESLMRLAHVEIGQKRKVLGVKDGQLKLLDPQPQVWFQTFVDGAAVDLKCSVGDFTQVSMHANQALIEMVMSSLENVHAKTIIEFGSGVGNFTLPLSARFDSVFAFEMDAYFAQMLEQNLLSIGTKNKVQIFQGDYQRLSEKRQVNFTNIDAVVVDPPRSGLKGFIDPLLMSGKKPRHFIYVSCFPESFAVDLERLKSAGYRLMGLTVLDQFPHSPHMELVAHLIDANPN